jgi:hypothetical protein
VDDFTLEEWVFPELFDLDKNISLGTTETAQASSDGSQLPDADICPYGTLLNSDIDEFADSNTAVLDLGLFGYQLSDDNMQESPSSSPSFGSTSLISVSPVSSTSTPLSPALGRLPGYVSVPNIVSDTLPVQIPRAQRIKCPHTGCTQSFLDERRLK